VIIFSFQKSIFNLYYIFVGESMIFGLIVSLAKFIYCATFMNDLEKGGLRYNGINETFSGCFG